MQIDELRTVAETLKTLGTITLACDERLRLYLRAANGTGPNMATGREADMSAVVTAANALPLLLAERDARRARVEALEADCRSFRAALEAHEEVKAKLVAERDALAQQGAAMRELLRTALPHMEEHANSRPTRNSVEAQQEVLDWCASADAALAEAEKEEADGH